MTEFESSTIPVAVILITYNGRTRGFLEKAINSVLRQSARPQEFVVVDDGSQDETDKWIHSKYDGIRVLRKINGGPASARNFGIQQTNAPFICLLDDDDEWLPSKLEEQFRIMLRKPSCDVLFTALRVIDEHDAYKDTWLPASVGYSWPDMLLRNSVLAPSSTMIRRDVFEKAGLFKENRDLIYVEDYDFWIRVSKVCKIESVSEPLINYREHSNQGSENYKNIIIKSVRLVVDYARQDPELDPQKIAAYHYYGAFFVAISRKRFGEAVDFFKLGSDPRAYLFILLLRSIGVSLRFTRRLQRIWRYLEYRLIIGARQRKISRGIHGKLAQ